MNNDWSDEETDNANLAHDRNYYKVERWTKDGRHINDLLYAGNNLDKAREMLTSTPPHTLPCPAGASSRAGLTPSANAFACWPIGPGR